MNLTLNIAGLPETERLFLRALTEADLPFLASILQDPSVMYAWEHTFTDQEVADFLRASLRRYEEDGFGHWVIVEKSQQLPIGLCGLLTESIEQEKVLGIGWFLRPIFQHQGYAAEAAAACRDYAFSILHAPDLYAQIRPENLPSCKVAERIGMSVAGQFVKTYRGKQMPHLIYRCPAPHAPEADSSVK